MIKYSDQSLNSFGRNNVGLPSQTVAQHYISIGQCIVLSGVSSAGVESFTRIVTPMQQSENTYKHPIPFQYRASFEDCGSTLQQHWVNAPCLREVYSRPSDGLVLGQHRKRLTGIEPAIGCDAGPTLNRHLVGRSTSSVRGTSYRQVLNECWPAPAMVVEGIYV